PQTRTLQSDRHMAQRKSTGKSRASAKRDSKSAPAKTNKVIHVVFGPGGGRLPDSRSRRGQNKLELPIELLPTQLLPAQSSAAPKAPLSDLFSQGEIARLLKVSPGRLRTLDRSGVVCPTGRRRGRRAYTFADLIQLRAAQSLL